MNPPIRRSTAGRAAAALAVLMLALSFLALSTANPAAQPRKESRVAKKKRKKPPTTYWGGWLGSQLTGTEAPYDMGAVHKFQGLVGKGLSLVEWSLPFADCFQNPCHFYPFPTTDVENVRQYGAIPVVSWASQSVPNDVNLPDFQLQDIIQGRYDDFIRSWAVQARDWGHPYFLRFDWEMNGDWFPWGEAVNGNHPGEFAVAWRHVHDIFTSVGSNNATWIWCPLAESANSVAKLRALYPGSPYVDWTCLDAYNWGATPANPHPWRSFKKIFIKDYTRIIKKVAKKKPMILAELGSHSEGGNKARWITKMFKNLRTDFRRVRAIIWFDVFDQRSNGVSIDWPVETTPGSLAAFRRGVSKRAYRPNVFGGAAASPIPPPPKR